MGSLLDFALPCWLLATLPKERGPGETVPGRKAETDRVRERISEGFRPAQPGRVAPRGREPMAGREAEHHGIGQLKNRSIVCRFLFCAPRAG